MYVSILEYPFARCDWNGSLDVLVPVLGNIKIDYSLIRLYFPLFCKKYMFLCIIVQSNNKENDCYLLHLNKNGKSYFLLSE
jgi:hypothetical protein